MQGAVPWLCSTLMVSSKFITANDIGPGAAWVLICGPTCIGKTHFRNIHKFYKTSPGMSEFKGVPKSVWEEPAVDHHNLVTTSNFKHWPPGWFSKNSIIRKRAIILGAPYFIWKKRVKERRRKCPQRSIGHLDSVMANFTDGEHAQTFKENYIKYIRELDEYNIPYIFVDNRNDYPILDESNFLIMLSQSQAGHAYWHRNEFNVYQRKIK